eukprot:366155-Chlamydomonas_euryale.AAC.7
MPWVLDHGNDDPFASSFQSSRVPTRRMFFLCLPANPPPSTAPASAHKHSRAPHQRTPNLLAGRARACGGWPQGR